MTYVTSFLLGLVQGVAEFLPISSSGHLAIAQNLLGLEGAGSVPEFFDVLLHLGTLIAVFAVKYMPAENVDWALHALHHSRITPVLAVRDGNITPALLKRKFGTDARAVYPKLSTRLALSERGGGRPYALLMREGLMPYAEVVLGSKRLCASAKRCTVLAFLAATASTLLAFYLTFVGAYSVLTPFSLLIYVLLWSLSALVDALLSDRY